MYSKGLLPLFSKDHGQHFCFLKVFLRVNSSGINKPFKDHHGKISVTKQIACEMPKANAVKVAEKNQFSREGGK